MAYWDAHRAVLRTRNLAAQEGDRRFRDGPQRVAPAAARGSRGEGRGVTARGARRARDRAHGRGRRARRDDGAHGRVPRRPRAVRRQPCRPRRDHGPIIYQTVTGRDADRDADLRRSLHVRHEYMRERAKNENRSRRCSARGRVRRPSRRARACAARPRARARRRDRRGGATTTSDGPTRTSMSRTAPLRLRSRPSASRSSAVELAEPVGDRPAGTRRRASGRPAGATVPSAASSWISAGSKPRSWP